jgi:L-seryl-tRNA(Ser) seleniumtransferase
MGDQLEREALRALPSVERLLQTEPLRSAANGGSRTLAVDVARQVLDRSRAEIRAGNGAPGAAELAARASVELTARERPRLVPVINATGVVIHTNLGRAPLALEAIEAIEAAASGYSNLEYDLPSGTRGSRQSHVEGLVRELTGAQAALVVNNNAAAVLLAAAALAAGREIVVSRGQLVEIGGSFRIPEILAASGASLVEVGTTNRTRVTDYERAIGPATAALMRVHPSNFRTLGFTEEPALEELTALASHHELPVIDDVGSGVLTLDAGPLLADEPAVSESLAAGAEVVCCSGD